jgi:hypothetical protein
MTTEEQALAVANNRQALLKRLLEARSMLVKEYRKEFTPYTLDFERKRLVSASGQYFLQWELRSRPDLPISYENQQTNRGNVYLAKNRGT